MYLKLLIISLSFLAQIPAQENVVTSNSTLEAHPISSEMSSDTPVSPELKKLLEEHKKIIADLQAKDELILKLINESKLWNQENNTLKKGHVDSLVNKAERLGFSNELRQKIGEEYMLLSGLIKALTQNQMKAQEQRVSDDKKYKLEQSLALNKKLADEKKQLEEQLKKTTAMIKTTSKGKTLSEENVQYFTATKEVNLQSVAWQYYNDNDKWIDIYDYPGNKDKIKEKSPSAIISIGTELIIPSVD
jgi:hypothetical protein